MNDFERLAELLAAKHRIPKAEHVHPAVIVPGDEFMTEKLKDPDYVPYCLHDGCGRTRRTAYGFKCPDCGNKMNYDLRHYDGNKGVQYVGEAPPLEVATSGLPPAPMEWVDQLRDVPSVQLAERRLQHAERKAWNDQVEAKKLAKKGRK